MAKSKYPPRRDRSHLHPAFLDRLDVFEARLSEEGLPFALFEAIRIPPRQTELKRRGSSRSGPWHSDHQYGIGADYVLRLQVGGRWKWSWKQTNEAISGAKWTYAEAWKRMGEIAEECGLEWLGNSKKFPESPHVALPWGDRALRRGVYPPGGSESWARNIAEMIATWPKGAPPPPTIPDDDDDDRPVLVAAREYTGTTEVVA